MRVPSTQGMRHSLWRNGPVLCHRTCLSRLHFYDQAYDSSMTRYDRKAP